MHGYNDDRGRNWVKRQRWGVGEPHLDEIGRGEGGDASPHNVDEFLAQFGRDASTCHPIRQYTVLEGHEAVETLALDLVVACNDSCLSYHRMRDQGRFHFSRAQQMTAHIEHIVDATCKRCRKTGGE